MAKFSFSDLHSFKDYLVFVQTYSPNRFHPRQGVGVNDQWTLELAFDGVKRGLDLGITEKGNLPEFGTCKRLVDEAYLLYREGKRREGFVKMGEVVAIIDKIPTR